MNNFIGELIKSFQHFLTRDIMYLVGGGSVLVTLLHVFGQSLTTNEYPTAIWLLAAGVAYGVGYALQEILSLFPFLTTEPVIEPSPLVKWLYRRYTRTDWKTINGSSWHKKMQQFEKAAPDRIFAQLQRTIGLKHIGATLGSNWLVCGIILIIYWALNRSCWLDLLLAIMTLVLAIGLIATAWIKGAQQTQRVSNWQK